MLYISLQTMPALTREPSSYQSAPTLHEGATRDLTNKIGCKSSNKKTKCQINSLDIYQEMFKKVKAGSDAVFYF